MESHSDVPLRHRKQAAYDRKYSCTPEIRSAKPRDANESVLAELSEELEGTIRGIK